MHYKHYYYNEQIKNDYYYKDGTESFYLPSAIKSVNRNVVFGGSVKLDIIHNKRLELGIECLYFNSGFYNWEASILGFEAYAAVRI